MSFRACYVGTTGQKSGRALMASLRAGIVGRCSPGTRAVALVPSAFHPRPVFCEGSRAGIMAWETDCSCQVPPAQPATLGR